MLHFCLMREFVTLISLSAMAGVLKELKTGDGVAIDTEGYFGFSCICVRLKRGAISVV